MTEILARHAIERIRHETRMRLLEVTGITDVTPRMRRFTLRGDMTGFVSASYDDHIKAFFFPEGIAPKLVPVGPRGAEFAEGEKPEMRDYTPRAFDVAAGSITLDFVLHGDGPASSWAAKATLGDHLVIGGPRGSAVVPNDFDWYLLVGDETALPAFGRRIEELPADTRVIAVIEVEDGAEEQHFSTAADLTLIYVHRNGRPAGMTTLLLDAVRALDFPPGEAFAHLAGESITNKAIRQHLEERGWPAEWLKAAGYWLLGTADAHEPH